jgi:hypothetical protein
VNLSKAFLEIMITPGSGPNPQDPNSPLYDMIDTQPSSSYPNDPPGPDISLSHFTVRQVTPTAISATLPIVVTAPNHGFLNGQGVRATKFIYVPLVLSTGMQQLNFNLYYVQNATIDSFELFDRNLQPIDGRNFNTYISGGQFTNAGNTPLIVNPAFFPPAGVPPLITPWSNVP